jgi:hypothetical protein
LIPQRLVCACSFTVTVLILLDKGTLKGRLWDRSTSMVTVVFECILRLLLL